MNSGFKISAALVLLLLAAALLVSCEDSAISAPSDGQIIITANPATVILDPDAGINAATSTIVAQVFDGSGFPLENVGVTFSSSGGLMASGTNSCVNALSCSITGSACAVDADCEQAVAPRAIRTDVNGHAVDVLTVRGGDPDPITVTVFSSTLSQTVDVDQSTVGVNQPPEAVLYANPPGPSVNCTDGGPECNQQVRKEVRFNGSLSTDDERITCYKWVISGEDCEINGETVPNDYWVQGSLATSVRDLFFECEQSVDVELFVSDAEDASFCTPCPIGGGSLSEVDCTAAETFFNASASLSSYDIICANEPPRITQISGSQSVVLVNGSAVVNLSANGTDTETTAPLKEWDCNTGGGFQPGTSITCTYTSAGTKTATFRVTDDGNPTGTGECQKSTSANVTIVVSGPTMP